MTAKTTVDPSAAFQPDQLDRLQTPLWSPPAGNPASRPPAPQAGWYWAAQPTRRTSLGGWGLVCSISTFAIPALRVLMFFLSSRIRVGTVGISPALLTWGSLIVSLAAAITGITLSAKGMSRRYLNRGLAIAGLVVGIVGILSVLAIMVAGVITLSS